MNRSFDTMTHSTIVALRRSMYSRQVSLGRFDASAVERSRVGNRWACCMGILIHHYLSLHYPRQPIERGRDHHDSPGLGHGVYRCRRFCDLY